MAFLTTGGSQVGSSQIVDGAIVNADVNNAAAIAQSKIGAGLNGNTDIISFENEEAVLHSLTTLANQRVIVIVTGVSTHVAARTITVSYGGVAKQTITTGLAGGSVPNPYTMIYSEVPGAATADITVAASAGSLSDTNICVLKIKSA